MSGIAILTPSGDRPECAKLLGHYIRRQTFRGPLTWVFVDDGQAPYRPIDMRPAKAESWRFIYHRRYEPGVPGGSLNRNVIVGLRLVPEDCDRIIIMEDDDWYAPDYVERYAEVLEHHPLVGATPARYYNVASRSWTQFPNGKHASLAETALRRELIPAVDAACRHSDPWIDLRLWRGKHDGHLLRQQGIHVGIKGMPGRRGIGAGHRAKNYTRDPGLEKLIEWIGPGDAAAYARFGASKVSRNWFEWIEEQQAADPRPWAVIGKGPSFALRGSLDMQRLLRKFQTIGLNHVCREMPVTVAHVIDLDVIEQLGTSVGNAEWLVMPWHPHRGLAPRIETLPDLVAHHPGLELMADRGRLLHYHLSWAERYGSRPASEPVVGVKNFSVQPAINLIIGRYKMAVTLGVDGGTERAAEFADEPPGNLGRGNQYSDQFAELQRICKVNHAAIMSLVTGPLAGSDPEALRRLTAYLESSDEQ